MFTWGADWTRGFRLKQPANHAQPAPSGPARFLELRSTVTDLAAGRGLLVFTKPGGDAFIIRSGGGGEPGRQKFVSKGIKSVSCRDDDDDDDDGGGDEEVTLLTETGSVLCVDSTQTPYKPRPLPALSRVLVCQVACGSRHTVALSADGQVFTWGRDSRGQLGLGHSESGAKLPECVRSLRWIPVVQVAAGGEQSFARSVSGGVFAWGRNDCGQLGLGDTADRRSPAAVGLLNMKQSVLICCGKDHTATLTQDGSVFTFGSGRFGQLGHNSTRDELRPRLVAELWGAKVTQIACGRRHTLVLTDSHRLYSFGGLETGGQLESHPSVPLRVQLPRENLVITDIYAGGLSAFATCTTKEDVDPERHGDGDQLSMDVLIDRWTAQYSSKSLKRIKLEVQQWFSSPSCINRSFLDRRKSRHLQTSPSRCGLDLSLAQRGFEKLLQMDVLAEVHRAVLQLLLSVDGEPVGVEGLRTFLLLAELLHVIQGRHPQWKDAVAEPLAASFQQLSAQSLHTIGVWWSALPRLVMIRHVRVWKVVLLDLLQRLPTPRNSIQNTLLVLQQLYDANERKRKIPETTFQSQIDGGFLEQDLVFWRQQLENEGSVLPPLILSSHLFVMDLESRKVVFDKNCLLTKNDHQVQGCLDFFGFEQPDFFDLRLRRTSLLDDTFQQLNSADPDDFRKPLAVYFNEDPKLTLLYKRDFFHHLFVDMVSNDSGMFMFNDSKTLAWFRANIAEEDDNKYYLFGVLCGLALYNGSMIHLPFPLVLFKKLLKVEPTVEDMVEFCPVVGRNLRYILNYEDDDLEALDMDFVIHWDGTYVDLAPKSPGKPVTSQNKTEFMEAYVNYAFNTSVHRAFQEFERGFFQVCDRPSVQLFRPEELRGVLVGHGVYDWDKLKLNTEYESWDHPDHPHIRRFWEVFDELSEEKKKDFIWFLTGFRRVPILGMNQIRMRMQETPILSGSPDQHFPEALTCYSIFILPPYSTKEVLRDRLMEALKPERDFLMDP